MTGESPEYGIATVQAAIDGVKASGLPITFDNICAQFTRNSIIGQREHASKIELRVYNLTENRVTIYTEGPEEYDVWTRSYRRRDIPKKTFAGCGSYAVEDSYGVWVRSFPVPFCACLPAAYVAVF
eukprot:SAG31_NODE_418_length_15893_cov_5.433899_9_plen_126_part_00